MKIVQKIMQSLQEFTRKLMNMKASTYLLLALFFILLPKMASHYHGVTGRMLVAVPRTQGIDQETAAADGLQVNVFEETVLYVARHTPGGALGFIMNRPIDPRSLGFPVPAEWQGIPLYYGGPVGHPRDAVFYMYREDQGLFFSSRAREGYRPDGVMLGYAGWTVMQLNYEIMNGYWDVIDYDPALVFETPTGLIWDKARRRALEHEQGREGDPLKKLKVL